MLLELFISGKGGGGGGTEIFELDLEGGVGGGGGGGGGRVGATVILGGGGLDGKVLCIDETLDKVFGDVFRDKLDGTLCDGEDTLRRFGGKGGALRV